MKIAPKRIVTAGGTLFCALGIGFLMQGNAARQPAPQPAPAAQVPVVETQEIGLASAGTQPGAATDIAATDITATDIAATDIVAMAAVETPVEELGEIALDFEIAEDPAAPQAQAAVTGAAAETGLEISEIALTSALPTLPSAAPQPDILPSEPVTLAALDEAVIDEPITEMPAEEPTPAFACDYELDAAPVAAAMVELTLTAPCMINERFTLHHNGMMFTDATNDRGFARFTVPALTENAVFIVAFGNGAGAVANAQVSGLDYYDRVVVQWEGDSGLQIHALEFGAHYGDDGHIWADAAGEIANAARGQGGFLTRHGATDIDSGYLAEVYSFPSGLAGRDGQVALSVEAEVTAANCGRDIEAQALQIGADGKLKVQELELAMPECNAVGDFLVLKNLLNDLKIAAN